MDGIKKIRLYHSKIKENIWIDCNVNDKGLLVGKACVFDKEGNNIYLGYFSDGHHKDSSILCLKNNTKVKYYFKDSVTYKKLIYYDDKLHSESLYEKNKGKWSITYDLDNGEPIGDTLAISGGGMGNAIRNNTLANLKNINTEIN